MVDDEYGRVVTDGLMEAIAYVCRVNFGGVLEGVVNVLCGDSVGPGSGAERLGCDADGPGVFSSGGHGVDTEVVVYGHGDVDGPGVSSMCGHGVDTELVVYGRGDVLVATGMDVL